MESGTDLLKVSVSLGIGNCGVDCGDCCAAGIAVFTFLHKFGRCH